MFLFLLIQDAALASELCPSIVKSFIANLVARPIPGFKVKTSEDKGRTVTSANG